MNLHTLKPAKGVVKQNRRLGRGEGSGRGGTSTRGHKGAKSRSGYSKLFGFEGGQMPLQRRVPKFGFKNRNRTEYKVVNIGVLQFLAEKYKISSMDKKFFTEKGLTAKKDVVKVLGGGNLTTKLTIEADAFSKSAIKAIEAAKGKAISKS